ncbi:hypothetical protein [Thermoactinomyces sp. DSM 45891]|uniref:hypothetical protein n=1 Tax=Thermoactinomyces sp. DSM 45891 TaxID=1761907 RepID=UPI0015A69639|nr:hypothetical protein [Thermoactinomyces sp. DSM 45891]
MSLPTDAIGIVNPHTDTIIVNPLIIVIAAEIVNLPIIAVEITTNLLTAVPKIHVMIANAKRLSLNRGPFFHFRSQNKKPPYMYGASHQSVVF